MASRKDTRAKQTPAGRGPGWGVFFLSLAICASGGMAAGVAMEQRFMEPAPPVAANPSPAPSASDTGFSLVPRLKEPMNLLFMACDVDYEERHGHEVLGLRGNTDTMILARLDPAHDRVRLLSIPRDTRVPIPGHGTFKINACNPYGGPDLSMQVVSTFLGVPVDRYLVVNTKGVKQLVDALGGVNMFVPKDLNYDDHTGGLHIHLAKGWNHLDGQHAHDFLRFRHDDLGDIGRVQRQQMFLQALIAEYLTPANLLKTPQLIAVAKDNMATNLTNGEVLEIGGWGKDVKRENVQLSMVPGKEAIIAGGWYWQADEAGTRQLVANFLSGDEAQPARAPQQYRIALEDGVGDRRAMHQMHVAVARAGYGSIELDGLAPQQGQPLTRIIAQQADIQGARALAAALGVGQVEVASTGSLSADFTVVMGQDWINRQASQQASGQ